MGEVEVREPTPMQIVCGAIAGESFRPKISQALPPGISEDRFVRVTLTAIQQNPALITGDVPSLYNAVVRCAQDGLFPDGRDAAFVMFKDKVQYMPMIGGLRRIAAGYGISLAAYAVHEKDEFTYRLGFDPTVTHQPPTLDIDRGAPIGAYAVATDRRGDKYLEVMSRAEIEQVRSVSRAKSNGPWVDWWGEMARKTVARRLWKQLPLADVDERTASVLAAADDEFEFAKPQMTVAEANVHAAIGRGAFPDDGGPVDEHPVIESSGAVVGESSAVTGPEDVVGAENGAGTPPQAVASEGPVPAAPEQTLAGDPGGGRAEAPSVAGAAAGETTDATVAPPSAETLAPPGSDGSPQAGEGETVALASPAPGPDPHEEFSFAAMSDRAQAAGRQGGGQQS